LSVNYGFIRHILEWVEEQKKVLELARASLEKLENADRLTLLTASRQAIFIIQRTLKGFENWLNSPTITTIMPEEMLKEVQKNLWDLMFKIVEFDIKHSSEYVEKLKEGKISTYPLLMKEIKPERGTEPPYSI
jgi:hypothetical protein